MEAFNIGDLVELVSGSPTMTVKKSDGGEEVYCVWFAGKKLDGAYFHTATLKKISFDSSED